MRKEFYKLVRDKVPSIMVKHGDSPCCCTLNDREYRYELQHKFQEETDKLLRTMDAEGFADVLEVMTCMAEAEGFGWESILAEQKQRRRKRGSYKNKQYLLYDEIHVV